MKILVIQAKTSEKQEEKKEAKEDKTKSYTYHARSSSFSQRYSLQPVHKDKEIKATMKNGLLTIRIPKRRKKVKKTRMRTVKIN